MKLFAPRSTVTNPANAQLESSLRELGWDIDERDGDRLVLHFKGDEVRDRRDISIMPTGDGRFVSFWSLCPRFFPPGSLVDEIAAVILLRNTKIHCGGWASGIDKDGDVYFVLRYATSTASVTAEFVRDLCASFVAELALVEQGLAKRGLL